MGLDLSILPAFSVTANGFSHDVLQFHRDNKIFEAVQLISENFGKVVEFDHFTCFLSNKEYEEYHYGTLENDKYGNRIKYVKAVDLKSYLPCKETIDSNCWRNRAIISYIMELPDDLLVYIFWH